MRLSGFLDRLGWLFRRLFAVALGHFAGSVGAERCPLAVAVLAQRQQIALRIGDHHAHHGIFAGQVDSLDATGIAAHRPGVGLIEANRHAVPRAEYDLVAGPHQGHVDQGIVFVQADADDTARAGRL